MKIGILTFHWATNYGAVLQAYSLQEILKEFGADVKIIDYKPKHYNDNFWTFFRYRKFLKFNKYIQNRSKEKRIARFRNKYLEQTCRYSSNAQLKKECIYFDILISGSDQVLNPSFLQYGERGGSTAYFLNFGQHGVKKICYAASFGTTQYPPSLIEGVKEFVSQMEYVSTRENSGYNIFSTMGAENVSVVPDPTLLHSFDFYDRLLEGKPQLEKKCRAYILHNREVRFADVLKNMSASLITDESIEDWINSIKSSSHLITNSFHGTVFAILYHIPFTVVLPTKENIGMNDRFYTLLSPLGLTDHIISENEFNDNSPSKDFDWTTVDFLLKKQKEIGVKFLTQALQI